MKVINFVEIDTSGNFDENDREILQNWTFMNVTLSDGKIIKYRKEMSDPPTKVRIRDRMLILNFT